MATIAIPCITGFIRKGVASIERKPPRYLIARLRAKKDKDIIEAITGIERGLISALVREGVRRILFGDDYKPSPLQGFDTANRDRN